MTVVDALQRGMKIVLLVISDIVALLLAYYGAFWLRFDGHIPAHYFDRNPLGILGAIGLYVFFFGLLRLYHFAWRFASLETLLSVVVANTLGLAAGSAVMWMSDGVTLPRSVIILIWGCSILMIGALRITLRMTCILVTRLQHRRRYTNRRSVHCLILGAGDEAVHAARLLRNRMLRDYHVLGFLDHRMPPSTGYYIFGSRILGGVNELSALLSNLDVDEVIIALPQADGRTLRRIALECRANGVTPRLIPSLENSLQQGVMEQLPEVSVEDLLRRETVRINLEAVQHCLHDRVVLVTGAGGSIGSEMCRQIMQYQPHRLLLLGHGENSIHRIAGELAAKFPEHADRLSLRICDIRDDVQMEHIFSQERPEVVFHAAAHKHVPLMELNPCEAVKNNVGGTTVVASLAGKYGVKRFLFISTDKAVNPTSIMGATKWVCEEVVRKLAVEHPGTRYITTRFGNVLGSRGSVVPIFREQIAAGGPVTVTHPQMTRFFMTIPEAVQLVLSASAVGESGEVMVLDMGEPMAILDLAREMIRLAGMEVDRDVKIVFTGLRPGEKLHEQLFGLGEERLDSPHAGLCIARRPQYLPPHRLTAFVNELLKAADHWDPDLVCHVLAHELPTLNPPQEEGIAVIPPSEAA